jgi:trehalose 6-phosphate phosphatase
MARGMASEKPAKPTDIERDLQWFWKMVAAASSRILMLDYDGTLSPFCADRGLAFPYPGVCEILDSLFEEQGCRIVVISGRSIQDLIPLMRLKRLPEIWGSHGIERRQSNGLYKVSSLDEVAVRGLEQAYNWIENARLEAHCERKPGCLALHWRGLPVEEVEKLRSRVYEAWFPVARSASLELRPFDGGLELRVVGCNKGNAVRTILTETNKGGVAVYMGDDATDEDAFLALKGHGLGVLVRNRWRPTNADCWIKPPIQLLAFLRNWRIACGERKALDDLEGRSR